MRIAINLLLHAMLFALVLLAAYDGEVVAMAVLLVGMVLHGVLLRIEALLERPAINVTVQPAAHEGLFFHAGGPIKGGGVL